MGRFRSQQSHHLNDAQIASFLPEVPPGCAVCEIWIDPVGRSAALGALAVACCARERGRLERVPRTGDLIDPVAREHHRASGPEDAGRRSPGPALTAAAAGVGEPQQPVGILVVGLLRDVVADAERSESAPRWVAEDLVAVMDAIARTERAAAVRSRVDDEVRAAEPPRDLLTVVQLGRGPVEVGRVQEETLVLADPCPT